MENKSKVKVWYKLIILKLKSLQGCFFTFYKFVFYYFIILLLNKQGYGKHEKNLLLKPTST